MKVIGHSFSSNCWIDPKFLVCFKNICRFDGFFAKSGRRIRVVNLGEKWLTWVRISLIDLAGTRSSGRGTRSAPGSCPTGRPPLFTATPKFPPDSPTSREPHRPQPRHPHQLPEQEVGAMCHKLTKRNESRRLTTTELCTNIVISY